MGRGGGFPGGFNPQQLMRQVQQMQQKMEKAQEELKTKEVEASSGGGMVTVTFNGAQELVRIKIEKEVLEGGDAEMLQDLVTAAVNEGIKKSKDMQQEELGKVAGPGMGGMGGLF
jgi:DNA-binding YbaB/EbfC family protein